jgi:hypothetical protein
MKKIFIILTALLASTIAQPQGNYLLDIMPATGSEEFLTDGSASFADKDYVEAEQYYLYWTDKKNGLAAANLVFLISEGYVTYNDAPGEDFFKRILRVLSNIKKKNPVEFAIGIAYLYDVCYSLDIPDIISKEDALKYLADNAADGNPSVQALIQG